MSAPLTTPLEVERDDRSTIAVFGTVTAVVIAALYYIGRIGFDNPSSPILITLGLSLFVGVAPFVAWWFLPRGHYEEAEPWWTSQAFITLIALSVSANFGRLVPALGINLGWVLAAVGYLCGLAALVIWIRKARIPSALAFIVFAAVFAAWACGVAWSTRYKTPVFWETLEYRADVHHDPLYYVSMANNMRTYGVPSTGLDGVPYTPYHYGSAWLNSQWAYLANTDVLGFYSLGPSVIVIPLFFSAVLLLAVEVKKGVMNRGVELRPLRSDYVAWAVFLAATIGIIPSIGLDALGIWNRHALISESYVIGLPVFLLIMCVALAYWRRSKTSHRASDYVFLFVFIPVALVIAGFLKVSTMLLLLAAGLSVVLLGRLYHDRAYAFSAFIAFVVSGLTYKLVSVAAQNQGIVPFAYMRAQIDPSWWPLFPFAHLFWSFVYIVLRLREERVHTIGEFRHAALGGKITDVVVVAVVALAGWGAGEVLDIHGGSAIYFSDVQRWLALSLLMASGWRWVAERRASRASTAGRAIRLSSVLVACLLIPISITIVLNSFRAPATAARADIGLRRAFLAQAGMSGAGSLTNINALADGLRRSPEYNLISSLRSLDKMDPALKRKTAVFIPQSDSIFWHTWREPERCSYVPFLVPAVSGLALVDGMAPVDCDLTVQYGMSKYQRRTTPQTAADVTPLALCMRANAKGFSRLIEISHSDSTHVSQHVIECPTRIALPR
jgi:hypothetical protein